MAKRRERRQNRKKVSARRRAEEHKSGFSPKAFNLPDGITMFQVKREGVKRIDIIPYEVPEDTNNPFAEAGELHFERTYFVHRDVGPDGDMYPCLKKTFGKACPICDFRGGLLRDPDADEKTVRDLAPKERQLWNVFDHDEQDKGVQLWEYSFHLFGKQLDARITNSDEEDGYEFFADPDEGMMLKVGFSEKSLGGNPYFETVSIDFKPRRKPIEEELLNKALILDDLLIQYDYDDLKQVFLQTKEGKDQDKIREDKDDEQEEKPKRPKQRGRRPARSAEKPSEETKPTTSESTKTVSRSRRSKPKEEKKDPAADLPKAKDFGIEVNMWVEHDKYGECSVVGISKDQTAVYILDEEDHKHSVGPDELVILEEEEEAEADEEVKDQPKASEDKEDDEEWDDWDEDED